MRAINYDEKLNGFEFTIGDTVFEVMIRSNESYTRSENKIHDHFVGELLIIEDGNISLSSENNEFTSGANEIVFLPKLTQHISLYNNATFYSVGFSISKSDKLAKKAENTYALFNLLFNYRIVNLTYTQKMKEKLDSFNECFNEFNALNYYLAQNELRGFFILLSIQMAKSLNVPLDAMRPLGMVDFIVKKRLCFDNFSDLKLGDLAKELYISPRQLSRIIKKTFGVSFAKRKQQLRIETAKMYLKTTANSIEQIALKLNFYDVSAFTKSFKGETGLTPTEYRNSITDTNKNN